MPETVDNIGPYVYKGSWKIISMRERKLPSAVAGAGTGLEPEAENSALASHVGGWNSII